MEWVCDMQNFYIFRHGETNLNKEGRFQGQSINPPLNEDGEQQAIALKQMFEQIPLEIIYSSPLQRAMQTAQAVADAKDVKIEIDKRLIEGNLGIAEGQLKEDIQKKYPTEYANWRDFKNMEFAFQEGESKGDILNRIQNFLKDLCSLPYQNVGISTHAGVIRSLLISLGVYEHKIPNAQILHVVSENGKFSLVKNA